MTVEDWNAVKECCTNIIHKWYNKHGVFDKPRDIDDKIEDATWYTFYLLEKSNQTIHDLKCKLVTYCYMPCLNVLLKKQTQFREKTERVMEIFENVTSYDAFEDDLIDRIETWA